MRRATLYLSYHLGNRIFDPSDPIANRDNCLQWFRDLKGEFLRRGYDLSTQDINPVTESEFTLYCDMPRDPLVEPDPSNSFLIILEPPTVKEKAWDSKNWSRFKKVFTYRDDLVDDIKFFKFNYAHQFLFAEPDLGKRPKDFVTMIGNKSSKHPFELYSRRREVIRWFELNHPEKLDLFGPGWEEFTVAETGWRGTFLRKTRPLSTYKGQVRVKANTLKNYRFAFCYENCGGVNGYISEKLFDALFAGTVPIYLGAPNIDLHIPTECFIDARSYSSTSDLYQSLAEMPHDRWAEYILSGDRFLRSSKADPFRSELVARSVVDEILSESRGAT